MKRLFTQFSRATFSTNPRPANFIDDWCITCDAPHSAEMIVELLMVGGRPALRVKVFDDAFDFFGYFADLFVALRDRRSAGGSPSDWKDAQWTADEFRELLLRLGVEENPEYLRRESPPRIPEGRTGKAADVVEEL